MEKAPKIKGEGKRMEAVYASKMLDTPAEERFDLLTKLATKIFHVHISTLTIVDANREWFKSCQGLSKNEGERAISFCGHAVAEESMMVINDTNEDERFRDNPMVIGKPFIRFYAGVPIKSGGQRIGVFCIKDTKPRYFSKEDRNILKGLAALAELEIELKKPGLSSKEQQKLVSKYLRMIKKYSLSQYVRELNVDYHLEHYVK